VCRRRISTQAGEPAYVRADPSFGLCPDVVNAGKALAALNIARLNRAPTADPCRAIRPRGAVGVAARQKPNRAVRARPAQGRAVFPSGDRNVKGCAHLSSFAALTIGEATGAPVGAPVVNRSVGRLSVHAPALQSWNNAQTQASSPAARSLSTERSPRRKTRGRVIRMDPS